MGNACAVVGIGQSERYKSKIKKSMAGLVREAAQNALNDAGCTWADIDAVIIGKAPDFFEGVVMPELYLADALGCVGKPMMRVHTAGSVGGSTAIVAASHIQSGVFKRVLTLSYEKQSESNAMWALSTRQPFSPHLNAGAGGESEISVTLEPDCRDAAVLSRLDSLPPAALIEAPAKRRETVVKNPETLKKLSI